MKLIFIFLLLSTSAYTQWTTITNSGNGFVVDFEEFNGELFATGFFTNLDGVNSNYVIKYNGSTWQSVGAGFPEAGHHLTQIGNSLYGVTYEPDVDSNWLYLYDGTNFNSIGQGVYLTTATPGFSNTANLYDVIEYDGDIILCGEFDRIGSQAISGIAKWNGTQYSALGTGLSGNIPNTAPIMYPHAMCLFGSDLIVTGNFQTAGGQTVNGIAAWDGTQWSALGDGFNSTVYGVCEYNGELYAGGDFTASGSTTLNYLAKWNGTDWVDPGYHFKYASSSNYSFVHTITKSNNKLFVAGGFDQAVDGTQFSNCVGIGMYENGAIDTLLGGIPNHQIEAVTIFNDKLFVGGGTNNSTSYIGMFGSLASLDEYSENRSFIFPNPSKNTIQIREILVGSRIAIKDMHGRIVKDFIANESDLSIEIENPGVYFVSIFSQNELKRQRIVIE